MDLFASDVWGKFGVTFDATSLQTDGYVIVAEEERGAIDNEANVEYQNFSTKLDYNPTDRVNLFVRAGMFDEDRNNGKIGEVNDTNWKFGSGGARLRFADGSNVEARMFFDNEDFFQNTFAVPAATPPRSQSNLSLEKTVPTNAVRIDGAVVASVPVRLRARTSSRPEPISGGSTATATSSRSRSPTGLTPLIHRVAGGTQRFVGVFAQDLIEVTPKLQLTLSARIDSWRNYDAHNLETTIATGQPTARHRESLADKSDTTVSPRRGRALSRDRPLLACGAASARVSARRRSKSSTARSASAQVLTLANETLGPERLTGEEVGVSVAATRPCHGSRDVLQQPRERSDRQRHRGDEQRARHTGLRRRADLPAAAEPRQHEHRGIPDRRRRTA